jgi:hypothetical protein
MTDRDILIHLAEKVMRWAIVRFDDDDRQEKTQPRLVEQYSAHDGQQDWCLLDDGQRSRGYLAWNPLRSMNDAYEVESALLAHERAQYIGWLECVVVPGRFSYENDDHIWALMNAGPRERSTALWKSTKDRE